MQLTDEQKEQLKMARRANMRIEETWSLYTMFLSQGTRPAEALERAQEAVTVWVEWMDHNEVDPPDIKQPDFGDQIAETMQKMFGGKPPFMIGAVGQDTAAFITGKPVDDAEFPDAAALGEDKEPPQPGGPKEKEH